MKNWVYFTLAATLTASLFLFIVSQNTEKIKESRNKLTHIVTSEFSVEKAPKDSISGTVIMQSGEVAWQSRTATAAAITQTITKIQQGESIETHDNGKMTVSFPNIGTVSLTQNSSVDIVQTLPANTVFAQKNGSITYTKSGNIPVSIQTLHALIDLNRGTMSITKSKTRPSITISIVDGDATIAFNDINDVSTVIPISTGKTVIYNDLLREVE